MNAQKPIVGKWIETTNLMALDNYLNVNCGDKKVFSTIEKMEDVNRLVYISDLLSLYSYTLDGFFNSIKFEYNPIENYSMEEITNFGNQKATFNAGNRKDTYTNTNKVSPFDIENFVNNDNSDGTNSSDAYTDTSITDSYENKLTRKGNIGTTTTQEMIISERKVVDFQFFKEIQKILENEILLGVWE